MENLVVQPKKYEKKEMSTEVTIPAAKGGVETSYPFQWLVFKPQAHAVEPFEMNKASRNENTARSGGRTHADFSKGT
jgi:hypothetical protein